MLFPNRPACLAVLRDYGYDIPPDIQKPQQLIARSAIGQIEIDLLEGCLRAVKINSLTIQNWASRAVFSGVLDDPAVLRVALEQAHAWLALPRIPNGPVEEQTIGLNTPIDAQWSRKLFLGHWSAVDRSPERCWYNGECPSCVLANGETVVQCVLTPGIGSTKIWHPTLLVRLLAAPGRDAETLKRYPLLIEASWHGPHDVSSTQLAVLVCSWFQQTFTHLRSEKQYIEAFTHALVQADYHGSVVAFSADETVEMFIQDDCTLRLSSLANWALPFKQALVADAQGMWTPIGAISFEVPASAHQRIKYHHGPVPDPDTLILGE